MPVVIPPPNAETTKPFDDALNRVLPWAKGCPDFTAVFHLREAAIEFFQRTLAWREFLPVVALVANQDSYAFDPPGESVIVKLLTYEYDGRQYDVVDGTKGQALQVNGSGMDVGWTEDRRTFRVSPVPQQSGKIIKWQVALKPTKSATTLQADLYEQYIQHIAHGALGSVLTLPIEGLKDERRAAEFRAKFETAIHRTAAAAARGFGRTRQRVRAFTC